MGSTNKTQFYDLPQWIGSDKPTFLGDFNDAFLKIDAGINEAKDEGTSAAADAGTALSNSNQAIQTANSASSAVETVNNAINSIKNWVTIPTTFLNGNTGSIKCYYNESLSLLHLSGYVLINGGVNSNVQLFKMNRINPNTLITIGGIQYLYPTEGNILSGTINITTDGTVKCDATTGEHSNYTRFNMQFMLNTLGWGL